MRIEALAIHEFRPFRAQTCELGSPGEDGHRADVHILVGENGTGKTRLLSLLMALCGNSKELDDRSTSTPKALVRASTSNEAQKLLMVPHETALLVPTDNAETRIRTFNAKSPYFVVHQGTFRNLREQANDTATMAFRSVAAVRDEKLKPMGAANLGNIQDMLTFTRNDSTALCQAILNMKIRAGMYLAGNPSQRADRTTLLIERLEKTLEQITGRRCIFLVHQQGEDVYTQVVWGNVRMWLRQLPDGLRAIIGWLAGCVARLDILLPNSENPLEHPVVLFLDEPETHLHPAWQRKVIPALKTLLPKSQIFVATHSPFVVSSVNDGWIYILKAEEDGTVQIHGPKECSKGDTYIDAVEDVLGLREWYDPETEGMLAEFRKLRDVALKTFAAPDKDAMFELARKIAQRSGSLDVMMGQELAQFSKKEKSTSQ